MTSHSKTMRRSPLLLVLDFLMVALVLTWLSGGLLFITPELQELFRQKPWIHRLLMNAIALSAAALAWLQMRSLLPRSALYQFFQSFPLKHSYQIFGIFILLTTVLGFSAVIRHEVFHTSFDMAIFVQAIWNTAHGHFLYSSIKGGICLLGDHFSPLLAVLAIPYRFCPDPKLLLILQAAAAASCVFPLDRLARKVLKNRRDSLLLVLAFALYLPLWNAVRFDFHPEVLVMPALLMGFVYLLEGKERASSLWLVLALLAKETVPLVTFMIGFYAFFFLKKKTYGAVWMAISPAYFFTVVYGVIPRLTPQGYFYLDANFMAWQREGGEAFLRHLLRPSMLSYLFKIFAPVGFLSFLDFPSFMLTLPMLAQNLLSRNDATRSIFFQYTALLTPYVFISAVFGARKFFKTKWGRPFFIFWVLLSCGVSEFYVIREHQNKETPHFQKIRRYFKTIPESASVRTHEFFAPHLAHRKSLHIYENQNPSEGASQAALQSSYVVLDEKLLGHSPADKLEALRQSGYEEVLSDKGFHIFIRKI